MKVEITGKLRPGVTAKDITLSVIGVTGRFRWSGCQRWPSSKET